MSRYTDVPWPKALAPKPKAPGTAPADPLPKADVLVVTWTVDEGHALSRVLTPGKDSRNDYVPYRNNFAAIRKMMVGRAPAVQAGRLGTYWTTFVGGKKVVVFKSDSHMSQDGPKLPNLEVWKQIIRQVRPGLVITTGTAGGIGTGVEVGDVVVAPVVRFDCKAKFKSKSFRNASYRSRPVNARYLAKARQLMKVNAGRLPPDNKRPPKIIRVVPSDLKSSVVTTDFFGFDTSSNYYKLQGLGDVSEMGDAVLGLACSQIGGPAPRWVAVRNVSDPQIKSAGLTLREQAKLAAQIYKGFGRWSSVCSAIACWALIAAE
jgi:hypothetical protein